MKKLLGILFAAGLLVLGLSIRTQADLAKPSPKTTEIISHHTALVIKPDSGAYEARLQIAPDSLKELRAALEALPSDASTAQAIKQSATRTIIAGISLFAALSFGGVLLIRSGSSRGQKTIAAALIGTAVLGAAAILTRANAGPPPAYRWRKLTQNLNDGKPTYGGVNIELVSEGNGITLILPIKSNGDKPKTDE